MYVFGVLYIIVALLTVYLHNKNDATTQRNADLQYCVNSYAGLNCNGSQPSYFKHVILDICLRVCMN
jgi:hypothetical protein